MTKLAPACLSMLCLCAFGAQVYKADFNTLDLDSSPKVVTNVTFEGLALTNDYPRFVTTNTVDVRDVDQGPSGLDDRRVAIGANADASGHIENDDSNNNHYQSVAIGNEAKAKAPASVAIGPWAKTGDASPSSFGVAIGYRAYAPNQASVAIGSGVRADGDETDNAYADENGEYQSAYAIAAAKGAVQIGAGKNTETNSLQFRSVKLVTNDGRLISNKTNIVIGIGARADVNNEYVRTNITGKASTYYGIAIGAGATSDVSQEAVRLSNGGEVSGIAIGRSAKTTKRQGVALGSGSSAKGSSSIAIGYGASVGTDSAAANNAIAIGPSSGVTADKGISIGNGAKAYATGSIAIGNSAIVESGKTYSVQLGEGTCTELGVLRFRATTLAYGSSSNNVKILSSALPIDKMWNTSGWANNKVADAGVVSNALVASISTNNPAFVNAVTNCPVSLPDSDPSLAGWGTYGTLGALLAAIIAGVANLNSNKADKADLPYPFTEPTQSTGIPQLPASAFPIAYTYNGTSYSGITSSDVELNADELYGGWSVKHTATLDLLCHYTSAGVFESSYAGITSLTFNGSSTPPSLVFPTTLTVQPRTVATYTADSSAAAFSIAVSAGVTGAARDCVLVVDCTGAGAVAPTVTWPNNFHPRGGDAEEIAPVAGVRNVFYVSEYATDNFVVGGWHEEVA